MTTHSFSDISSQNWQPTTTYQVIQEAIQSEVEQGLWENEAHIDTWCTIAVSEAQGVDNSWVTHTYQNTSNPSQTTTVLWPANWPPPAENKFGQLPSHFFIRQAHGTGTRPGVLAVLVLSEVEAAPNSQPTYKPAGICI